jgi:hypothetical protein
VTPDQASRVMALLASPERSLKELARLSGLDEFTFYQGADLTSLNLSGQNLEGLNFDRADLRFSEIENTSFDAGAFNGSTLDDRQNWLIDEFEFYARDVFEHPISDILIFCKFRPDVLDRITYEGVTTYGDFAQSAGVSENALRKARRGKVVAYETAYRILTAINDLNSRTGVPYPTPTIVRMMRQPVVAFLSGGINMPFKTVTRERLRNLVSMRHEIIEIRKLMNGGTDVTVWRDTPEFIESMLDYYRNHRNRMSAREETNRMLESLLSDETNS